MRLVRLPMINAREIWVNPYHIVRLDVQKVGARGGGETEVTTVTLDNEAKIIAELPLTACVEAVNAGLMA